MGLLEAIFSAAFAQQKLDPITGFSKKYKNWISVKDFKRCKACHDMHGKIWLLEEKTPFRPPLHPFCRCKIEKMKTIQAGTATINKTNGADWTLKHTGALPEYYITIQELKTSGWRNGKALTTFLSNKMLAKGIYKNRNGHLPDAPGRVWYEADINYTGGKRNSHRILWSNDGLIFVTYDHYETFYEII